MKKIKLLFAFAGIVIFMVLATIIPWSKSPSHTPNYAPEGFKKTRSTKRNNRVLSINQNGLFWVYFDDHMKYPFSYDESRMPIGWEKSYPQEFIIAGDSILKMQNNDTFYVVRAGNKWLYILPQLN